jgi:hypothetical protein
VLITDKLFMACDKFFHFIYINNNKTSNRKFSPSNFVLVIFLLLIPLSSMFGTFHLDIFKLFTIFLNKIKIERTTR